ncbi:MAG: ATP-binding protein [Candidatus Omnitrophica bacterium]|nr:ATP-binding protein [Candidatus Omnitrophota bacterium]
MIRQLYSTLYLVGSFIVFSFGILIFLKNRKNKVNFHCGIWYFTTFIWLFFYGLMLLSSNFNQAYFWAKVGYSGVVYVCCLGIFNFIISFLEIKSREIKILSFILGLFALYLLFSIWRNNAFIDGLYQYKFGFYPRAGMIHPIFLSLFFSLYLWMGYNLYTSFTSQTKIKELSPLDIYRRKYLFLVAIISSLASLDFLPNYGFKIYPLGFLITSITIYVTFYAITRYNLLDIKIVAARFIVFIVVYTLVLGLPFGLVAFEQNWLVSIFDKNWFWAPMISLFILATCGPFIFLYINKKIENRIKAEELHAHQLLKEAARGIILIHDLPKLFNLITHMSTKILKVTNAFVFCYDKNNDDFYLASIRYKSKYNYLERLNKDNPIIKTLLNSQTPLVYEEIKIKSQEKQNNQYQILLKEMQKLNSQIIIPTTVRGELFAFLGLDAKKSQRTYTSEDVSTLWALSFQVGLGIENILLYEREKQYLAERARRQALADMAPGASHQFNNRLATISAIVDNLAELTKDEFKEFSKEEILDTLSNQLPLLQEEIGKAKQITSVILQKSKVKFEFSKVDIVKVIENAINATKLRRAKESLEGIKEPQFIINASNDLPKLTICEGIIQDVCENMFNNGADATIIKQKRKLTSPDYQPTIKINVDKNDNYVIITIEDNGIGIEEENLKKIFTPYFTTKATAEKGITGGYGLGLWIIREFIEDHGGKLEVSSEYTKWTKFTIKLPINFKPPNK